MENEMRSIGEMARDSGLGVSTLRFYDRAGVLAPARVDPVSGYRWYAEEQVAEARLLARLRRAAMPLADIRLVLAGWSNEDTDLVRGLLQTHLRRLERGLSDARSEFSTLRSLLDHRENPMALPRDTAGTARLTVPAPALAAALDAVRFAVGTDPELPMLHGVLFDVEGDGLRVVATDRYRMAVARVGTAGYGGPRVRALVPAPLTDAMRALLGGGGPAELALDGTRAALETVDRRTAGQCLDHDFPDYRRLVRLPAGRRAVVDAPAFREAVRTGPVRTGEARGEDGVPHGLSVLRAADDGTVTLCDDGEDDPDNVAVNRAFLLDALAAGARDRLVLEFGSPTAPLAVRRLDDEETFSLLMPVRLEN
ncbi:MerR family transcriptional regulator [Streptomyces sp. MRC013]|uniref:DNA polymerase III subunit beta family protein n=1 Tax=Streptomyces sp. MRC013 TaxID=2898276 RepID=UPI002025B906|nr:MerR family transcriptional regulator [Streptomyces sp. MRC013]URM88935.1 MerR family transcriptional regulator [Streptomyces sp. MRC013]